MFHKNIIFTGGIPVAHGYHLQVRCPVEQVGEVKVLDVVAGDDVRVRGPYKLRPTLRTQTNNKTKFKLLKGYTFTSLGLCYLTARFLFLS